MKNTVLTCLYCILFSVTVYCNDSDNKIKDIVSETKVSGQMFLSYNYNDFSNENLFTFKRGYLNFKNDLNDYLSVRFTQDITLDKEGSDAGNIEMRLKYLYMQVNLDKLNLIPHARFAFGLNQRPWIDYEQKINKYRVQSKMFIERNEIINSADFGLTLSGTIGSIIDYKYTDKKTNGKFGSYSIGIYNGGGYHAFEENKNKTFEGRLTLRPLPTFAPGFQVGYSWVYGAMNLATEKPFEVNLYYFSFQNKYSNLMAQYYKGRGNMKGNYLFNNIASTNEGLSIFGEILIPKSKFAIFGRYDNFISNYSPSFNNNTTIAGTSYNFFRKNLILADFELRDIDGQIERFIELALEIRF